MLKKRPSFLATTQVYDVITNMGNPSPPAGQSRTRGSASLPFAFHAKGCDLFPNIPKGLFAVKVINHFLVELLTIERGPRRPRANSRFRHQPDLGHWSRSKTVIYVRQVRMRRCLFVFLSVLPLFITGCKKRESTLPQSTASPTASANPTPVAQAIPTTPRDTNRTARFIVLLYHRFENRPAELVITPNDFRAQMKALRDNGISVISMQGLLAWRNGEKSIPSKSAVITMDDEWNSQYYVAWPIMKEFRYPFTLFVYTQWVNTGGKAMTWAQLEEMRDAGVDIEAHTVSHHDLRHAPRGQDYTTWLHNEVYGCKETLESELGVKIIAFAFPYGFYNEAVRKTAKEAGYEMQFTVYGRHMDINVPADQIGRYAIDSLKGDVFKAALDFGTNDSIQPGVESSQLASAAMLTEPLNDQHITEPRPTIKANLASMGDADPKSVEMRISGFGVVPAIYDAKTKLVTYKFTQKLVPKMYTVILTAQVNGKKVETRWEFTVDPAGPFAP
jgi:peptidoglycan/xylan/chitin deacetylase (PgdA/CDA1 family)